MKRYHKNKKNFFLFLVIFLSLVFSSLATGNKTINAATCEDECSLCTNEKDCVAGPARCKWDGTKNKCFEALEVNWPPSPAGTSLSSKSDITNFVKYLYEWGITLGGFAVFIALLLAGFQYLTSVGKPEVMKEAWDRGKSAIFGLILLLGSWLILNTINEELTTLRTPSPTPSSGQLGTMEAGSLASFFEPCKQVYFYPEKNYQGTPDAIGPTEKCQNTAWLSINTYIFGRYQIGKLTVNSIKVEGNCLAILFKKDGCTGDDMEIVDGDIPDFSTALTSVGSVMIYNLSPPVPVVVTKPAEDIEKNSATLKGYLEDDGGKTCEVRFSWGKTTEGQENSTQWISSKRKEDYFSEKIQNLEPNTAYYFRAEAKNDAGIGYGLESQFTTKEE